MPGISFLGAASGLDLNGMISQLVALEQQPIQREQQKVDLLQYKQEVVRDFRTKLVNIQTTLKSYTASSLTPPISATVADTDIVTATAESFAPPGVYNINVTQLAQNHIITGTKDLAMLGLPDENTTLDTVAGMGAGTFSFDINGITVTFDSTTTTLAGLRNQIQTALSDPGATAGGTALILGSGTNKRISISAEKTGVANGITFVDTDGKLAVLGLDPASDAAAEFQAALDTNYSINGVNYTTPDLSDSTGLSGVTFSFKDTGATTLTIALDSNKVKSDLQSMVDQYNSFYDEVSAVLTEKKVASPSTFAEFVQGTFSGDTDLINMLSEIRYNITSVVSNTLGNAAFDTDYSFSAAIGLDSEAFTSGNLTPHLSLDAAKFDAAFSAEPDAVMAYLAEFATRLDSVIADYSTVSVIPEDRGVLDSLDKAYEKLIDDTEDRIGELEDRVEQYEARLRAQFSAMELAIQKLQLQQGAIGSFGAAPAAPQSTGTGG